MIIDFNQDLKGFDEEPVYFNKDKKNELKATLKLVATEALMSMIPTQDIDGPEKLKRYKLAGKIQSEKPVDLTVEEVAKIRELIGITFNTLVVGSAYNLLEGGE